MVALPADLVPLREADPRLLSLETWLRRRLFGIEWQTIRALYGSFVAMGDGMQRAVGAHFRAAAADGRWRITDPMARRSASELVDELDRFARVQLGVTQAQIEAGMSIGYRAAYYGRAWMMAQLTDRQVKVGPIPTEAVEAAISAPYEGSNFFLRMGSARDDFIAKLRRSIALSQVQGDTIDQARQRLADGLGWDIPRSQPRRHRTGLFARAEMIARTECLTGDALIDSAVVTAVYRRWYDGSVIEINTADGGQITVTPNHPMLTARGWVPAGELHEGDDLISNSFQQEFRASGDEHIEAGPPTISQIFDALSTVTVTERERGRQPDFHGDGRDGEVDILRPDGGLAIGAFSPLYEPIVDHLLSPAHKPRAAFCAQCGRLLSIDQQPCFCGSSPGDSGLIEATIDQWARQAHLIGDPSGGFPGHVALGDDRSGSSLLIVSRVPTARVEGQAGLAERACQSSLIEPAVHRARVCSYSWGDLRHAQPRAVQLKRVAAVGRRVYSGHIYNLSTPYGYFTTAGVYTGNTIRTSNMGMEAVMQENRDILRGFEWISARDRRVCPICGPLDGRVFSLDSRQRRPPAHVLCRCSAAPAVIDSKLGKRETYADWKAKQTPPVDDGGLERRPAKPAPKAALPK